MPQPRTRRVFLGAAATGIGLAGGAIGAAAGASVGAQQVRDGETPTQLRSRAPGRSALYVVTDYGVTGDGSTDDSDALNRLLVSIEHDGGGVALLPHGTYLLGSALILRSGVQLTTAAPDHGYIALGERISPAVLVPAKGFRDPFMVDTDAVGIVSGGMSGVDVRGTTGSGGVRIRKGSWAVVSKAHIDRCGGPGLLVEDGVASVFEDLLITNCLLNRDQDEVIGALDIDGTDHYVSRCEANASLRALSSRNKRIVAIALRGSNHFVSDTVAEYSDVGLVVSATFSRFSNVRADTNWGDGWLVSGGGNSFAACSSIGNSQAANDAYDGWVISGGGNAFAACTVHTPGGGHGVRYGFNDSIDTAAVTSRNTYVGCTVDAAASARWSTAGFLGSSPSFAAHPVRPRDGTAEPDVSQTTLVVLFDYSTATTVTDFVGAVTGQTIRVLGNAQVTLKAGSRMRLRGGADRPMVDDDVVVLTWYDGAWYESGA